MTIEELFKLKPRIQFFVYPKQLRISDVGFYIVETANNQLYFGTSIEEAIKELIS